MQKFVRQAAIAPVLATLALVLSSCGEKATTEQSGEQAAPTTAAADQTPENAPGIALTDAIVQLPAVAGRPGVAYFSISNDSGPARKLVSVHIDGVGRTEMHETRMKNGISQMGEVSEVTLEPGKAVSFAPGGHHVMLFDLDPALKAGGTAELTVTLDNGDKASATAQIRSVGQIRPVEGAAMTPGSMGNHATTEHDAGHSGHDMGSGHDM